MTYWVTFAIILFFALKGVNYKHDKSTHRCLMYMWAIMTLFQGLRWNTGADWLQYYITFEQSSWTNIFTYTRGLQGRYMEPGYMFINVLIKTFFFHYTFFLLITCGFISYTYLRFVERFVPERKTLAYALVLVMMTIFPVRQVLACAFFFWAIPYILDRNWKRYFILVAVAYSIHYSCFILVFFYWLDRAFNRYILTMFYFMSSAIAMVIPSAIQKIASLPILKGLAAQDLAVRYYSQMEKAVTAVDKAGLNNSVSIAFVIVQIWIYASFRDRIQDEKYRKFVSFMINLFVIASTARQIALLPGLSEMNRFGYYCGIAMPILMVCAVNFYSKHEMKRYAQLLYCFLILMYFFKVNSIFQGLYVHLYEPYYFVFEDSPVRDSWFYFH